IQKQDRKELSLAREKQDWENQRALAVQKFEDEKKLELEKLTAHEAKLKRDYDTLASKAKETQLANDEEWEKRKIQMESERRRIQSLETELSNTYKAKEQALLFQIHKEEDRLFELEKSMSEE